MSELQQVTGLSHIAARAQLKRLHPQVVRVSPRQDFFLIVNPTQFAIGAPPAAWWLDAYFQNLKRPYYLALLSAAEIYGSSHQAVQIVQVITDRPMRALEIGRIRVHFYVKARVAETPVLQASGAHAPLKTSTPEATALDLLRYAHTIGGVSRAAQAIEGMASHFTKSSLRQALKAETELSTIQRLGFILEKLKHPAFSKLVEARLPGKLNTTALEQRRPSNLAGALPLARKWAISVNSDIELS